MLANYPSQTFTFFVVHQNVFQATLLKKIFYIKESKQDLPTYRQVKVSENLLKNTKKQAIFKKKKIEVTQNYTGKDHCTQDYCNRGERQKLTPRDTGL